AGGSGSIWIECHRSFPICPGRMRTCDFVLVTLEYSRCVGDHKSQNNFGERCQLSAGVVVQLKCTSARSISVMAITIFCFSAQRSQSPAIKIRTYVRTCVQ